MSERSYKEFRLSKNNPIRPIHGLFHNIKLRQSVLSHIAQLKNLSIVFSKERQTLDQEYDKLAEWVRTSIDMDLIYKMTGLEKIHNTQ